MSQTSLEGEVIQEFSYTRAIVEKVLAEHPKRRDDDDETFRKFVFTYCRYHELRLPASSETIRRTRQKIQNTEGKYPPSEETRKLRAARDEAIKRNLRYI